MSCGKTRLKVEELKERELLTPGQCVRVFGRSVTYWRGLFDAGEVEGCLEPPDKMKRRRLHLATESVRAYLKCQRLRDTPRRRVSEMTGYQRFVAAVNARNATKHSVQDA